MGRWTLRHTDEVLVTKIESIVAGAIRKLREEQDAKTKPSLSYEGFVENLDEEDTFVVTMIEILLKELADRRTRSSAEDKRLISQQTSESLHSLALSGTYHPAPYSRFRNRSTTNLNGGPGFLYTPADSDEDDYGIGDGMGGIEGARIDSALYDVYSNGGQMGNPRGYPPAPTMPTTGRTDDPTVAHRPYEGAASIPGRQLPLPHSHFIPASTRRWNSVFGSGAGSTNSSPSNNTSSLARPLTGHGGRNHRFQPLRARVQMPELASEFSEFAARRRSSHRQLLQGRDRAASEGTQILRTPSTRLAEIQPPASSTFYDLPRATLFDPPSPSTRDNTTRVPSPSPSTEAEEAQPGRTAAANLTRPALSRGSSLLYDSPENGDISTNPHPLLGGTLAEWRSHTPAPTASGIPLRRGGIPAPEMILPPADSIFPPDPLARHLVIPSSLLRPESEGNDGFERELQAFDAWSAATATDRMFTSERQHHESSSSSVPPQEAPTSLPTPRSVSPTGEVPRSSATLDGAAQ
ncbi:hypothetical protein ACEPAG_6520 [Sanghuangporus baumii]